MSAANLTNGSGEGQYFKVNNECSPISYTRSCFGPSWTTPKQLSISGKIIFSTPDSFIFTKDMYGFIPDNNLNNSSLILSQAISPINDPFLMMDSKVFFSMSNSI